MEVIKPGTRVRIGNDIEAYVSRVLISSIGVLYEVVWWDGRKAMERLIYEWEIAQWEIGREMQIGFKR